MNSHVWRGTLGPVHPLVVSVTGFAPARVLTALLVPLAVGACEPEAVTSAQTHRPDTRQPEAAAVEPEAPRYEVRVEAPSSAAPGKEAWAKVHVEPRTPWHMNTEFPVALRMQAPGGVTLEVTEQVQGDAERFDDDGLVFALPFTPVTHGPKRIAGEVDFAVCGGASCAPETVPVDFTVEVGCDSGALC